MDARRLTSSTQDLKVSEPTACQYSPTLASSATSTPARPAYPICRTREEDVAIRRSRGLGRSDRSVVTDISMRKASVDVRLGQWSPLSSAPIVSKVTQLCREKPPWSWSRDVQGQIDSTARATSVAEPTLQSDRISPTSAPSTCLRFAFKRLMGSKLMASSGGNAFTIAE